MSEFNKIDRDGLIDLINYWRRKARQAEDEYAAYQARVGTSERESEWNRSAETLDPR